MPVIMVEIVYETNSFDRATTSRQFYSPNQIIINNFENRITWNRVISGVNHENWFQRPRHYCALVNKYINH